MPRKRRIIKKKVKEPDEFISTSDLIIRYVRDNYKNVTRISVAVLIIFFLSYGWFYYSREKEKDASHFFYQTEQLYKRSKGNQADKEQYNIALGRFEKILKEYSGTSSSVRALFYVGDCYYHLGDYDNAIDYYTKFINESRKGDYLRCFAFEGLGYCYEEKGNYEQALERFSKSMEESASIGIEGLIHLNIARSYEALNDRDNALKFYKKVADEQSNSIFSELAQDKINTLKN